MMQTAPVRESLHVTALPIVLVSNSGFSLHDRIGTSTTSGSFLSIVRLTLSRLIAGKLEGGGLVTALGAKVPKEKGLC